MTDIVWSTSLPEDKLAQAKQRLKAGEVTLLVTAAEARQKELDFIGRFDQKIRKIKEVISPVNGTQFRVILGMRFTKKLLNLKFLKLQVKAWVGT